MKKTNSNINAADFAFLTTVEKAAIETVTSKAAVVALTAARTCNAFTPRTIRAAAVVALTMKADTEKAKAAKALDAAKALTAEGERLFAAYEMRLDGQWPEKTYTVKGQKVTVNGADWINTAASTIAEYEDTAHAAEKAAAAFLAARPDAPKDLTRAEVLYSRLLATDAFGVKGLTVDHLGTFDEAVKATRDYNAAHAADLGPIDTRADDYKRMKAAHLAFMGEFSEIRAIPLNAAEIARLRRVFGAEGIKGVTVKEGGVVKGRTYEFHGLTAAATEKAFIMLVMMKLEGVRIA